MRRTACAIALLALLLAGCGTPEPPTGSPTTDPAVAADVDYPLLVRVSQETADGPPMAGVEVQAFVLAEEGQGSLLAPRLVPASTDTLGFARFVFEEPSLVAFRASSPGWTTEGVVLRVEETVLSHGPHQADGGPVLSERDLFLPLYRAELRLEAATTLSTAIAEPRPNGTLAAAPTTADLLLPEGEGVIAAYLARLSAADVRLVWEDTASSRAHLSAGLAWDGVGWVRGEPPTPGVLPGQREAVFSAGLPDDGRPDDLAAARLQAAAFLESAAVGDVPVRFEVRLRFGGIEPPGLPAPCHSMAACLPLPPV